MGEVGGFVGEEVGEGGDFEVGLDGVVEGGEDGDGGFIRIDGVVPCRGMLGVGPSLVVEVPTLRVL